ncbi:hypothetical protein QEH52_17530 [Coraliomargarita sp. SDUM461003]|uniref:Uncharacterized protein n=1 Tax=Thalassobacterium maritimum TaxID=3041265 RepID=A0ABU1AYV1_9BACT|nr:hypothetical protein [Coraliomargarita sp. SDUM461003]MDQ8209333.1 hypothetical protein [Coraliomargarita sp. SDUM461003]
MFESLFRSWDFAQLSCGTLRAAVERKEKAELYTYASGRGLPDDVNAAEFAQAFRSKA